MTSGEETHVRLTIISIVLTALAEPVHRTETNGDPTASARLEVSYLVTPLVREQRTRWCPGRPTPNGRWARREDWLVRRQFTRRSHTTTSGVSSASEVSAFRNRANRSGRNLASTPRDAGPRSTQSFPFQPPRSCRPLPTPSFLSSPSNPLVPVVPSRSSRHECIRRRRSLRASSVRRPPRRTGRCCRGRRRVRRCRPSPRG